MIITGHLGYRGAYDPIDGRQGQGVKAPPVDQSASPSNKEEFSPHTATEIGDVPGIYDNKGRYIQSDVNIHVIEIEKALGPDHPDLAGELTLLAGDYHHQDRYAEAEQIYKRALETAQRVPDSNDSDLVAKLFNDLAVLYLEQGRLSEAEPLQKRAVEVLEGASSLGRGGINSAIAISNLGKIYHDQVRLTEAEPLYKQALGIYEAIGEPNHPYVAFILNELGAIYLEQGQYKESKSLVSRALGIIENTRNKYDLNIAIFRVNLAVLEELERTVLWIKDAREVAAKRQEASFNGNGKNDPKLAIILRTLAALDSIHRQGRNAKADTIKKGTNKANAPTDKTDTGGLPNETVSNAKQGQSKKMDILHQREATLYEQNQILDQKHVNMDKTI